MRGRMVKGLTQNGERIAFWAADVDTVNAGSHDTLLGWLPMGSTVFLKDGSSIGLDQEFDEVVEAVQDAKEAADA